MTDYDYIVYHMHQIELLQLHQNPKRNFCSAFYFDFSIESDFVTMSKEKERPSCLNIYSVHTAISIRWFGEVCETESMSDGPN